MSGSDLVSALKILKSLIKEAFQGQGVRNDILKNANNLNSAILMASTFASVRLNLALLAMTKNEKVNLLASLTEKEIESFTRLNEMCGPVRESTNALTHWVSRESFHKNISHSSQINTLIRTLGHGEAGIQELFAEFMRKPGELETMDKEEINSWIRSATQRLAKISKEASELQVNLAQIL